jgi:hypothetical protein
MSMFGWLARRRLGAFERTYDYDMSYARDILDADPRAFARYARAALLSRYREGAPPEAHYAASLAATLAEDCGPCTQLIVIMAEREGVSPSVLRAIVGRDLPNLPPDAALGLRFAEAVLRHDGEADMLRDEIVARWGKRGLVSLAFAVTAGRFFPTLKYALGHGRACTRVAVAGEPTVPARRAA